MHYTKLPFNFTLLYVSSFSCDEDSIFSPIQDTVAYYNKMSEYGVGLEYNDFIIDFPENVFNVTCFTECKQYSDRSYNICKGQNVTNPLALKIYALSAGFSADDDVNSFFNTNTSYMSDKDISDWNAEYRIKSSFDFTIYNKKPNTTATSSTNSSQATAAKSSSLGMFNCIFNTVIASLLF